MSGVSLLKSGDTLFQMRGLVLTMHESGEGFTRLVFVWATDGPTLDISDPQAAEDMAEALLGWAKLERGRI